MSPKRRTVALAAGALLLAGCAAGPNPLAHTAGVHGVAGFWQGLWHGLICPVAFVMSLFRRGVSIYEVHNNGWPYNLAFILGAGAWGMFGHSSTRSR